MYAFLVIAFFVVAVALLARMANADDRRRNAQGGES